MDIDQSKLASADDKRAAEPGDGADEAQLDEYGHYVDPETGESVSGPKSPDYHDPDRRRLEGPEFAAEPARITPEALAGDPKPVDSDGQLRADSPAHADGAPLPDGTEDGAQPPA